MGSIIEIRELGHIIETTFSSLLSGDEKYLQGSRDLIQQLSDSDRKTVLYGLIRSLSTRKSPPGQDRLTPATVSESKTIGGASALIVALVTQDQVMQDELGNWLIGISAPSVGFSHDTHRAVIAALSYNKGGDDILPLTDCCTYHSTSEQILRVTRKALDLFSEKLYIKHTPVIQQEGIDHW